MLFSAGNLNAFYATDILSFIKMTAEFIKQIKSLKMLIKSSSKLNEEFKYFKNRFLRIHKGLTLDEFKSLLKIEDIEFYYNNPYVRFNKKDIWRQVWKNPANVKSLFKYLDEKSYLKESELYKKNREFRKRIDYKIKGEKEILKEYKSVLRMLSDTKEIIFKRKKRYKNIERLIRKVNGQGATGKLLAIQNDLKIEQIIKLDLLITAIRVGMEMQLKEKLIRMDNYKKSEIDRMKDRKKDRESLQNLFSGE
jgi:hypothetical protein